MKSYIQWIISSAVEISRGNKVKVSLRQVKQDALALVEFEMQLADLVSAHHTHNITDLYKQMTIEQLQLWTDLISVKNHSIVSV